MLVSIDDRKLLTTDDIAGIIDVLMKSHTDHEYARSVSKNTLRGSIRKVQAGHPHTNVAPYGMMKLAIDESGTEHRIPRRQKFTKPESWDGYLIEGDKKEADAIRWLFEKYASTDISLTSLAATLNDHDDDVVRVGPTGTGGNLETVRGMLKNHHYAGKTYIGRNTRGEHCRTSNGDIVETKDHKPGVVFGESPYPGVVSRELFQRVQEKLLRQAGRNAKPRTRTADGEREGYPLTGCLVCGHCGHAMHAHPNKGNTRYQCVQKGRNTSFGCGHWSVKEVGLLPFLLNAIDRALLQKLEEQPVVPADDSEQQEIVRQQREIDPRISTLTAQLATATPETIPLLASVLSGLTEQRKRLTASRREIGHQERTKAAWERWDDELRNLIPVQVSDTANEQGEFLDSVGIPRVDFARFNDYIYARPSAVRELFHSLNTRVQLRFIQVGGSEKRKQWALDHGNLRVEIGGKPVTIDGIPGT